MRFAIIGFLFACTASAAAEGFYFDMPEPKLRFVVPDLPPMQMETHPNAAAQPHARYLGTDHKGTTLSILMPTAAAGMTPRDCARSISGSVVSRFAVDPKFVSARQSSESTYVMVFPAKVGPVIQFKAFLMSGHAGTHCIEVHISRTILEQDPGEVSAALQKWYTSFGKARIEGY